MRTSPAPTCDLFCNVIDNFGDAGVCWRLGCELLETAGWSIRLITDRPDLPGKLAGRPQRLDGVLVLDWNAAASAQPADIVIEAFGCRLPEPYLARMRERAPVWINLEYLSAEGWVENCHALPSPDPTSGLLKHFFFPGFTARTGGLIRERWLDHETAAFSNPVTRLNWLRRWAPDISPDAFCISLFCYPDSPIAPLFEAWRALPSLVVFLPEGLPAEHLQTISDSATSTGVKLVRLPFLSQIDFDRLLLACDLNFVRGEDSFVRAQWVARPMVWQAYRQEGDAHHEKLDAFLQLYIAGLSDQVAQPIIQLHHAWNGVKTFEPGDWLAYADRLPKIRQHARQWEAGLRQRGNLISNLADYCESRL